MISISTVARGRGGRHHRAEWRGQDHAVQPDRAAGLTPTAGSIRFDGRDPLTAAAAGAPPGRHRPHPLRFRSRFENLTVFENLLVGAVHGRRQVGARLRNPAARSSNGSGSSSAANTLAGSLTLAGTQAAGDGPRSRNGAAASAAGRDRRRPDGGRVPRTRRHYPRDTPDRRRYPVDRACRARACLP